MFLSGFKRSLKTTCTSINFRLWPSHKWCPCLRFVSLNWHMAHHQLHNWLTDLFFIIIRTNQLFESVATLKVYKVNLVVSLLDVILRSCLWHFKHIVEVCCPENDGCCVKWPQSQMWWNTSAWVEMKTTTNNYSTQKTTILVILKLFTELELTMCSLTEVTTDHSRPPTTVSSGSYQLGVG